MGHHREARQDEIFVGNTKRDGDCIAKLRELGVLTARLGDVAYDIKGKPLPRDLAPLLIGRSEVGKYDDIMMSRTFGPNWRRS